MLTNGEIGTDPPLVLFLTGVFPKVLVSDLLNHLPYKKTVHLIDNNKAN